MGYAPPGTNPLELLGWRARRSARVRLGLGCGGLGRRCDHAARLARRADVTPEARHRDHAAAGPLTGQRGDDRGHARPALGWPFPDGAGHVRPPGRRGLARPGVGEAARQDPRVRRDRPCGRPPRAARAPRSALRHSGPGRHRARQAVEADGAAAARGDTDLSRAIAPKAVEQAFEIADGWLPIFWSPEQARAVFPLDRAREGFDIAPSVPAIVTDDAESGRAMLKEYYSFYIGGMGARGKNFYNDLFTRYGYEAEAREIQDLFLGGHQREAARRSRTRSSTRSPWSAPSSGSATASLRGGRAVRRRCSSRRATRRRCAASPRRLADRFERRLGEQRHRVLEERGACVLAAELAADEASVDRFTEHCRLPERERLEPRERLHVAAAAFLVARDELRARRGSRPRP